MQKKRPSHRLLAMWMTCAVIIFWLLALGIVAVLHFSRLPHRPVAIAGGLLAVFGFGVVAVYLPLRYRSLAFRLTETTLTVYSGVFFRCKRTVPLSGIQYVTLLTGPAERLWRIGTLLVSVTGSMVLIEGIPLDEAPALQNRLCAAAEVPHA